MCGRKSGKGMFVYAKDTKDRPVNAEAQAIIKKHATVGPANVASDEDIALRLLSRCLFLSFLSIYLDIYLI